MGGIGSGHKPMHNHEFVAATVEKYGTKKAASKLSLSESTVRRHRRTAEQKLGRPVKNATRPGPKIYEEINNEKSFHPGRLEYSIPNGIIIVASDAHYWPGPKPLMHRALVKMIKELEPNLFVFNGDIVDLAAISRHPPIGWETQPTVKDEIETAQDRLNEIAITLKPGTPKCWPLGNHDSRFETKIATLAPQFAEVKGIHLRDHFPEWAPCWSCWVNNNIVIKHRYKNGIHAPWNNVMNSGMSMITGHLHSAKVTPFTDYTGTRYGVDTGCVADTDHIAFLNYTEDNPKNWRSAFGVLTIKDNQLLYPELVIKWDDKHVQFRGEIIAV